MTCPKYLKGFESTWNESPRQANLEWFAHAKFGLFLHYGLYSQLGRGEWALFHEKISLSEYEKLYDTFDPKGFDADYITDLACEAEMRYVNLTSIHHEGFALWDSTVEPWNSVNAADRDLVAELAEACDRKGLGFFTYFTYMINWRHPFSLPPELFRMGRPHYDREEPRYKLTSVDQYGEFLNYIHALLEELLALPHPLAGMWLDIIAAYYLNPELVPVERTYPLIREKRPEALISFKNGATGEEDFGSPEHSGTSQGDRYREQGNHEAAERADRAWELMKHKHNEICSTLQDKAWGWNEKARHLDADEVWGFLGYAGSINCNLLLNTGPLADGSIHDGDAKTLREVGRRIRRHGWPGPDEAKHPGIGRPQKGRQETDVDPAAG